MRNLAVEGWIVPSPGESPLDFLPYAASDKQQPGDFRLGPTPGLAKLKGVQTMLWAADLMEQCLNPRTSAPPRSDCCPSST